MFSISVIYGGTHTPPAHKKIAATGTKVPRHQPDLHVPRGFRGDGRHTGFVIGAGEIC
jgi:hypothetical protein